MLRIFLTTGFVAIVVLMAPLQVVAEDRKPLPESADSVTRRELLPETFSVDEVSWAEYMDEQLHEQFFEQAKQALSKGDKQEAARQLKHGLLYMRMEAGRATKEGKVLLKQSEMQLKAVDDVLKAESPFPSASLDSLCAKANFALARHHFLKAQDDLMDRATVIVGHDLRASANEWLSALVWSGRKLTQNEKQLAYDVVTVANRMIGADDLNNVDVDKSISTIGQQLEILGKTLK